MESVSPTMAGSFDDLDTRLDKTMKRKRKD